MPSPRQVSVAPSMPSAHSSECPSTEASDRSGGHRGDSEGTGGDEAGTPLPAPSPQGPQASPTCPLCPSHPRGPQSPPMSPAPPLSMSPKPPSLPVSRCPPLLPTHPSSCVLCVPNTRYPPVSLRVPCPSVSPTFSISPSTLHVLTVTRPPHPQAPPVSLDAPHVPSVPHAPRCPWCPHALNASHIPQCPQYPQCPPHPQHPP